MLKKKQQKQAHSKPSFKLLYTQSASAKTTIPTNCCPSCLPACLPAFVSANHRQGGQAILRQNSVNSSSSSSSNYNKGDGRECEPRFQPQLRFKTATTFGSQPKESSPLTKHQISKSLLPSPSLSHWSYYLYIKYEETEERKVRLGRGRQEKGVGGRGPGGGESKNHFFSKKKLKKQTRRETVVF
jgi:hypothetical protein